MNLVREDKFYGTHFFMNLDGFGMFEFDGGGGRKLKHTNLHVPFEELVEENHAAELKNSH